MSAHHSHPHDDAATSGAAGRSARALADALRARGMRMTPQREHVLAAVHRLGHATPDELSEAVDGVDVATVYRTLELLEELGLVRHTHLGHGAASYRPAGDQHIHVVCHACGSVVDAAPDLVDPLADRLRADSGFELDRAHFTVFGRCATCAAGGTSPAGGGTNTGARALSPTR
jgi:Fur family ferric uptake transcriptional regulator